MSLQNLTNVHTGWNTERVQTDFDRCTVWQEGHVLFRNNLRDHTFITVTSSHLIADLHLALLGNVDFDALHHTLIAILAGLDTLDLALAVIVQFVELTGSC